MKRFLDFIAEFFKDEDGCSSSMRLAFILTLGVIIGTWTYVCVRTKDIKPLPESVVTLALGMSCTKVVQKAIEKK
jgi:hypothetical protein